MQSSGGRVGGDRGLRIVALLAVLLVAGGAYLWVTFVADDSLPTRGPSMRPTMVGRDSIDVDSEVYAHTKPQLGEIVVVQAPAGARTGTCGEPRRPGSACVRATEGYARSRFVKRVVAGPGDRVSFAPDGSLIRNRRRVEEPYIRRCAGGCALPRPVAVPPGHYFLAGDNRPASWDSRIWGSVPLEAIDGRVSASSGGE